MRKKIVAGNWKMNTTLAEGIELAKSIDTALAAEKPVCGVVICVPYTHLASINLVIDPSRLGLGAEDCSAHDKGAYTGEVSASMVASTGASHVILGHSERRQYHRETAGELSAKLRLALDNGLLPIFCVGELLAQREDGTYNDVVARQLEDVVLRLDADEFKHVVIAYEPVWAIGTGKTATPGEAQAMHAHIRATIAKRYGRDTADDTTILYGGSCKPSNARELFACPDIDGGLIGGASLKCADFMGIVNAF